jgi:cold shock CspA family protein
MRCHVIVEAPHQHQHQGKLFDVRIDITVPDREIAIHRVHPRDHSHEDPYVALRDAFRAARRRLQDYERRRYQKVKLHEGLPQGRIVELRPNEGYGRIETREGHLVYFHAHSVLGLPFEALQVGNEVRFAEEKGDRGPQASTVHVLK